MQTTLQALHNSCTYLKILKDYVQMWVWGIYQITTVFLRSTKTPSLEITCLRYYTDNTLNAHFDFLIFK